MNPDELWIGKVLAVGLFGLIIWAVTALLQAKSEVARRIRIVLAGLVVLAFGAFLFITGGPGLVALVVAVIGIVVWIFKGKGK